MPGTTLKQMLANRLNALRSTGPKTLEGKARSSQNARNHGLSRAVGANPPADWAALIAERSTRWRNAYRPADEAQQWAFSRLVAESVRLDQCEARIAAARAEYADRASESWDDDRRAEVADLASRLSRNPDRIQPLLLQSRHGVLWLLDRWEEVAESLRRNDGWDRDDWQLALDLMGLPRSSRDGSGPWDLDPEDSSAAPGLDLVRQNVEALRERLDSYLDARDSRSRLDAELGLPLDDPRPVRLLERYAADARRRVASSLAELRRLQASSPSSSPAPTPETSSPPGPRPDRRNQNIKNTLEHALAALLPPARNEPNGPEAPARNEPNRPASPPLIASRPTLSSAAGAPGRPNRRARRAQAAASRRS